MCIMARTDYRSATAFDLTMMAHHCGIERSEQMWRTLIDQVDDLEIVKFWHPPEGEGIVQDCKLSGNDQAFWF